MPAKSDSQTVKKYLKRYQKAYSLSESYRGYFDDAYTYSQPNRNPYDLMALGDQRNTQIYDTTLVRATTQFVAQLHMALTPIYVKWTNLEAGESVPEELKTDINRNLDLATNVLFEYIWRSNFDLVINEAYYDVAVGTGAFLCVENEDDRNPLRFVSVPIEHISPEEGPDGTIETVWRRFEELPIRHVLRLWPKAKLNNSLSMQLKDQPSSTVSFIEGTVYNPKDKTYNYVVIDLGTEDIIFEEVTLSSPWIIFRWGKFPGETFGFGPVLQALPTAKTLNAVYEDELKAAALQANPIYLGFNDGVFNPYTVKLKPNTVVPVSPINGTSPLQPLPLPGNPNFVQVQVADLRQQINEIMFGQPLGQMTDPTKTATEISLRNQLSLEAKAPAFGRLQVELVNKLIDRVIYILKNRNLFPNIEVGSKEIKLNYQSPILQSQGLDNARKLLQHAQYLQSVLGPEAAIAAYNVEELPVYLAEALQVDLKLVKSKSEIEQIQAQAAQALQQQQAQTPQAPTVTQPM